MSTPRRKITPGYIFFYLLFSGDAWRVLCGLVAAVLLTPHLAAGRDLGRGAIAVLALMLVAIGWWVTAWPMERWAALLRRRIRALR
jgi:hypothetical protein